MPTPSEKYRRSVLDSGVTVLTEHLPHVRSIATGFWITRGTRDEARDQNGLSHLMEHMAFKGTRRRSARDIAAFLESIGGHLDAFTSKEETCYYARALDENLAQSLDILADILTHSRFDPKDLERERQVVLEEIKSVDDNPDDLIHDLLAEAIFDGHPLSYPVLGTRRNCSRFTVEQLKEFWKEHYRTGNLIVAVAGRVDHGRVLDLAAKHLRDLGTSAPGILPSVPIESSAAVKVRKKRTSQVHLCLGFPGIPFSHPDRYALLVLNIILGGGMSSRLYQRIREREALAYSVYSYIDFNRDTGLVGIYLGVARDKVGRSLALAIEELAKLKRRSVTTDEIKRAQAQLKGSLMLGLESVPNRMFRLARAEIFGEPLVDLNNTLAQIDRVAASDVGRVARALFRPNCLALAAIGPDGLAGVKPDSLRDRL